MIITIGSLKGGTGKSTAAVNAAVEFTRLGDSVVLVDADPNGTASTWAADREEHSPGLPFILSSQKKGSLRGSLLELDKQYDVVLVDVGGHDSQEFRTAGTVSDLLVVPLGTSSVETDNMVKFVGLLKQMLDFNPELRVRALFNDAPTQWNDRRLPDARTLMVEDFPELPVLDTALRHRNAFQDVMPLGRGVIEWTDSKAKAEIQVLVQELKSI